MKCGKMQDSERMYEKYLKFVDGDKVRPGSVGAMCVKLWILQKHDEAWKYLVKGIEANSVDLFVWYYYGVVLRQKHRFDEAIDAFDESIELMDVILIVTFHHIKTTQSLKV